MFVFNLLSNNTLHGNWWVDKKNRIKCKYILEFDHTKTKCLHYTSEVLALCHILFRVKEHGSASRLI